MESDNIPAAFDRSHRAPYATVHCTVTHCTVYSTLYNAASRTLVLALNLILALGCNGGSKNKSFSFLTTI